MIIILILAYVSGLDIRLTIIHRPQKGLGHLLLANRVFSAQHTSATDFALKLWKDANAKCILHNFLRKIQAQAVKNMHAQIFILWQIKGSFR